MTQDIRAIAEIALELTRSDWTEIGNECVGDLDRMANGITAVLLIRLLAIVWAQEKGALSIANTYTMITSMPVPTWPECITSTVLQQLRQFVVKIIQGYQQVCYHRADHAYHVFLSANKLLEFIIHGKPTSRKTLQRTYGLRQDTLAHFALLFSALIHDLDHRGVSNRQLILEADPLSLLYNDQSVAENRSLSLAFSLFMGDSMKEFRKVLFEPNHYKIFRECNDELHTYRYFRKLVIDLVLTTDIASPERVQIVKSKWKEAFGDGESVFESNPAATSCLSTPIAALDAVVINIDPRLDPIDTVVHKQIEDSTESPERTKLFSDNIRQRVRTASLVDRFFDARASSMTALDPDFRKNLLGSLSSDEIDVNNMQEVHLSMADNDGVTQTSRHQRALHSSDNKASSLDAHRHPRRYSLPNIVLSNRNHRFRLGICRALDLTGNPIEAFSLATMKPSTAPSGRNDDMQSLRLPLFNLSPRLAPRSENESDPRGTKMVDNNGETSISTSTSMMDATLNQDSSYLIDDEPNDLKAEVVLEHLMKAADVASLMQSWDTMVKWSINLFREQMTSFCAGRGYDATIGWFDNQLTFFESYVIPLAHRLWECKAFHDDVGRMFIVAAERNRNRWLSEGLQVTSRMIIDWEQR